jgi:RHS repeat-associated protein
VCDGVPVKYYIDHAIDYYPYGKTLREYFTPTRERYLTTQHERDTETGYDNRGARLYDADVMRFLSVDPLAEKHAGWNPYHFVMGNPLSLIDPDGRDTIAINRGRYREDLSDEATMVFDASISYIKNGVESSLSLPDGSTSLYMFGDRARGEINSLPNPVYNLIWKDMPNRTTDQNRGRQINIAGRVYIHPGNDWGDFAGCKGLCRTFILRNLSDTEQEKFPGSDKLFYGNDTGTTIDLLKQLYKSKEPSLTGSKFILRTQQHNKYTRDKDKRLNQKTRVIFRTVGEAEDDDW